MTQPLATHYVTPAPQGNLFALLPRQPRAFKGSVEDEFLPPRERRLM